MSVFIYKSGPVRIWGCPGTDAGGATYMPVVCSVVMRTGGDEFALLLEQCTHDAALRVAESVRAAISGIVLSWGQRSYSVGASIGVASLQADTPGPQGWLAEADAACYAVKAAGRGAVSGGGPRSLRAV